MAYENEIKYVVRGYAELETLLTPFGWFDIEQGYLNSSARVRCTTFENGGKLHQFTFKKRLPNGHNLEIESRIDAEQFNEAWEYTTERLKKRRVSIQHRDVVWDVDFYRWSQPYFILAEVEMPVHMTEPEVILPYLQPHIVYTVPRDDGRFAARRLSDEAHVRRLAEEFGLL